MLPATHEEGSDYINASYIQGWNGVPAMIAAQGPLPETVADFWRMVWAHGCRVIIMCTNLVEGGKVKASQYWPNPGAAPYTYGALVVENVKHTRSSPDVFETVLRVRRRGAQGPAEVREIRHFFYHTWPDHGVPAGVEPVLRMLSQARAVSPADEPPMVVHCSAGCGRTGSIIAIDLLWSLLKVAAAPAPGFALIFPPRLARIDTRARGPA